MVRRTCCVRASSRLKSAHSAKYLTHNHRQVPVVIPDCFFGSGSPFAASRASMNSCVGALLQAADPFFNTVRDQIVSLAAWPIYSPVHRGRPVFQKCTSLF